MKIKVWAVVDVHAYGGELDLNSVKLFLTEDEAKEEDKWYVVETELELDLGRTVVVHD